MFDWAAAKDRLFLISKKQLVQFLNGPDSGDVYGLGFFCDAYDGTVYLVANTEQYYQSSLDNFVARFGSTDPETFRWDIGNWKYPGGLFPSASAEQVEFDDAWKEFQERLAQAENDDKQEMLEGVCVEVLRKLIQERVFSPAIDLKGVMILGPDDRHETVLERKKRLDSLLLS